MKDLREMSDEDILADPLLSYASHMETGITLNEMESQCESCGFKPMRKKIPLTFNGELVWMTKYQELYDAFPTLLNSFNFRGMKHFKGGLFITKDVFHPALLSFKAKMEVVGRMAKNSIVPHRKPML